MKKSLFLRICLIILIAACHISVSAEECSIECETDILGRYVSIYGRITNVTEGHQVSLLVGDFNNIIYVDQGSTDENGGFAFDFKLDDKVNSGSYNFKIGSSSGAEQYEGVLVYTTEGSVACRATTNNGRNVSILGQIPNASSTNKVTLWVGDENNLIYSEKTISTCSGEFSFDFVLPDELPSGSYDFAVYTDAPVDSYNGVLPYKVIGDFEQEFFQGSFFIELTDYIPTITGSVSCAPGKELTFEIVNKSNNTTIAQDTITAEDGIYNLNYVLPSMVSRMIYTVKINCKEEGKYLFGANVYMSNSAIVLMYIGGQVGVANDVYLIIDAKDTKYNIINKTFKIKEDITADEVVPNIVSNASCNVNMRAYQKVVLDGEIDSDSNQDQTQNPDTNQDQTQNPDTNQDQTQNPDTNQDQTQNPDTNQDQTQNPDTNQDQTQNPDTNQDQTQNPDTNQDQTQNPDTNQDQTQNPDPEPDEVFQTIETEYSVSGNSNSMNRVMININRIPMLHKKIFTINYDPAQLELIDACCFTNTNETSSGKIDGTYIEILSVTDGQIRFKIEKEFSDNVVTSGVINIIKFKKLSSDTAVITSKIEKVQ